MSLFCDNRLIEEAQKEAREISDKITRSLSDVRLKEQYPHIKEAIEAFMSDSNIFLLIAVVQEGTAAEIYFFTKQNQNPTLIPIDTKKMEEILDVREDLKDMMWGKSDCTRNDVIDKANDLFQKLLDGVLPEKHNKEYGVWIYCEDKRIYPLWEWICVKSKDESGEGKYFFWGDKFCIVRKPKDRIPENYDAEDPNFKIKEVNILLDENSPPASPACRDRKCLRDLCMVGRETKLNDSNAQNNLKASDCIHIAADIEQFIQDASLLNALRESKNIKFLFLNLWGPGKSRGMRIMRIMRWINSISAKTWIDTILNVPQDFAPIFAKCFYECVANEKNVAEAVRKTREEIGEGYLFCITDGNLKKDLNKNIISKKLKNKFNDEDRPLSNTGTITITKENDKWTITDEEKRNIYIAREKDGKLKIYEKERNSGCKKFWRLAYVVKGNP